MIRGATRSRRGFVLIIAVGLCAMLVVLSLTFLSRMRAADALTERVVRYTQARIAAIAACEYILEAGRIGWDGLLPPGESEPTSGEASREAFGWIDVRDGRPGPRRAEAWRTYIGEGSGSFPDIGGAAARFPLHRMRRPPFAQSQNATPNPILTSRNARWFPAEVARGRAIGDAVLINPDPWPEGVDTSTWRVDGARWTAGDPTPIASSYGMSWFRIHRDGPATFIITCGGGATQGYRDWDEVPAQDRADLFADDPALFADLLAREARLWYRVEWSPAIAVQLNPGTHVWPATARNLDPGVVARYDDYAISPWQNPVNNAAGTIRWVQRLAQPPARW